MRETRLHVSLKITPHYKSCNFKILKFCTLYILNKRFSRRVFDSFRGRGSVYRHFSKNISFRIHCLDREYLH